MGESAVSQLINFKVLHELQTLYQKDINELIDLYILDTEKKFNQLTKAFQAKNFGEFSVAAKELRIRSLDVGAIQFSHACLSLEICAQEMRLEGLMSIIDNLQTLFQSIKTELLRIKKLNNEPFLNRL